MKGPKSNAVISLDISKMKDGDNTGLAAFNGDSGILTIKKTSEKNVLTMGEESVSLSEHEKAVTGVKKNVKDSVEIKSNKIYLRIDVDFNPGKDIAKFYYSLDNKNWNRIGSDYKMIFDYRRFFMGTRFAIFNYATKQAGGYVDMDFFKFKMMK